MAKITKADLIEKIATKTGFAKSDATTFFNAFTATIEEGMRNGDDIVIPGFGSWKTQDVKARVARNLQTNESITIPAHKRVKFTVGKNLKEAAATKKIDLRKKPKKAKK